MLLGILAENPPPPENPPPRRPELEPGAVDEEEIAEEKVPPRDDAKLPGLALLHEEPEYHPGRYSAPPSPAPTHMAVGLPDAPSEAAAAGGREP